MLRSSQNADRWFTVNRNMVAKAIAEMSFEQILQPKNKGSFYELTLRSSIHYQFTAWSTIWGFLRIDPQSLLRKCESGNWTSVESAGQFFIDAQSETAMDDIILGNFLEEMHRTLHADLRLRTTQEKYSAQDMIAMDGDTLQSLLDGHPKVLLNKGRIGWGASDLQRFAPESQTVFQLFWIALVRSSVQSSQHPSWPLSSILAESLQANELARFQQQLAAEDIRDEQYIFMPLHPWQWENIIQQQFAAAIALRQLVPLGCFGDRYRPQTSLRTMSNIDRPECLQIKLAVSILNTSSIRGLPAHYVAIAPKLSMWLAQLCERDPLLQKSGVRVLQDVASVHRQHEIYAKVTGAPYRYHEYLGAVWRESSHARLKADEQAVITASLFQKDSLGNALIAHWIERSQLTPEQWLKAYFEVVLVPLFHLQCKYGIGVVAHGQNIVLRLEQGRPAGMYLKDLQGDLRLVDEDLPELESLEPSVKAKLTRLPAHYLIHDLQTGHLITVLRFMSATLKEATGFAEETFYQLLASTLRSYHRSQPGLASRIATRSLLEPTMARVLINKVRFKIGYADSAERPLPALGTDLINPLHSQNLGAHDVSPPL